MTRYPADLDDDTNQPDPVGYTQAGVDGSGAFLAAAVHSALLRVLQLGTRAVQTKLGRGASTPALDRVLLGTGPGVSEWRALAAFAVTRFGVGSGQPGQALVVDPAGLALTFGDGFATDSDLAAHEADTTAVHGIASTAALVLTSDDRLSDQRVPTDGSVTNAKVAAAAAIAKSKLAPLAIVDADVDPAAAIAESKLALASDAAAAVPSRRTLGLTAVQALPGTHAAETGAGKHVAQQPAIANLNQTASAAYVQAEQQAQSAKIDAILGALRSAGVLAP